MKQYELFEDSSPDREQISLEELFEAYYQCRRNKRRTVNALAFELDFERELIQLWHEINSGRYKIGRSIAFVVQDPVQREVFAASFRDRVVHHLVIAKLNPLFEEEFIGSSYSCREGKGTLFGVRDVRDMITACSEAGGRDCYILKLDIKSFFMSIDKVILYQMLAAFIEEKYHQPDKRIVLRLVRQIVFECPEDNCVIKGKRADWNGLPCEKSLFWSNRRCGLPIGNLTSQIFANFYLNRLDKFVTEELGIRYYGRYVDDFVLIDTDKRVLTEARKKIQDFLRTELRLTLHPRKTYLQHYSKGVRFIGAVIKPNRIYIGKRSKNNLYKKIYRQLPVMAKSVRSTLEGLEPFAACVNSYIGFMRHYNTFRLRYHILSLLEQSFLGEVIDVAPQAVKISVNKMFRSAAMRRRKLRRQRQYRFWQLQQRRKGES